MPRWLACRGGTHAKSSQLLIRAGAVLAALGMRPLLDLGLRLGEGSGAAVAISVVRAAVACHSGMATFTHAAGHEPAAGGHH